MIHEEKRISLVGALRVVRDSRREDEVVITTMGAAREWMALASSAAEHRLDFVFVPSSMGQATSLGFGLALARPDLRIIVCNGDGSMLMNLGSLVSITAEAPANLVVIVFDNGAYEVTGAQPTPGSAAGRVDGERIDFAALARACGFRAVLRFTDLEQWRADARWALDASGPTFIWLEVEAEAGARGPRSPGPAGERARRFKERLQEITPRPRFSIRRALPSDAAEIEALIQHYVPSGSLLQRSQSFIVDNASDFLVAVDGDDIVGCAHLEDYAPSLAELRSLAVHPDRHGLGIGRAVADAVEQLARRREYGTLFAVSNDEGFFLRMGFEKRDIPELDRERSAVSRFKGVYAKRLR